MNVAIDLLAFEKAIHAPDTTEDDFITALNDWRPVKQKVKRKNRKPRRGKDETREGWFMFRRDGSVTG